MLERALAIRERSLGPQHRDVARTLADLASTLSDVGRPARAQTLAIRAVEIRERQGAPDAPEFATVLALYAKLQATRGDGAAARVIRTGTRHPCPNVWDVASALRRSTSRPGCGTRRHWRPRSCPRGRARRGDHRQGAPARDVAVIARAEGLTYAAARPRGQTFYLVALRLSTRGDPGCAGRGDSESGPLVLDEIAARQGAVHAASDREQPAKAAMTAAQQRLANLTVRGPGPLTPAHTRPCWTRRDRRVSRPNGRWPNSAGTSASSVAAIRLDSARSPMLSSPDTALVSLVRYDRQVSRRLPARPR